MGRCHDALDGTIRKFIESQRMFFVATAPSEADGHVNLSPKGLGALRILGPTSVAYLDYVGSGAETIAHLRQNGRIVLMLCAFEGPPMIVRLHGRGRVVEPHDPDFPTLARHFQAGLGTRAIIQIDVTRITDSCGFGVPLYQFEGERLQLPAWAERKGRDGLRAYQEEKNQVSIDGIPALRGPVSAE